MALSACCSQAMNKPAARGLVDPALMLPRPETGPVDEYEFRRFLGINQVFQSPLTDMNVQKLVGIQDHQPVSAVNREVRPNLCIGERLR